MGFDPNTANQPLVNVNKKTTQVNLWMGVGIALFLVICVALIVKWRAREGSDHVTVPEEKPAATSRP